MKSYQKHHIKRRKKRQNIFSSISVAEEKKRREIYRPLCSAIGSGTENKRVMAKREGGIIGAEDKSSMTRYRRMKISRAWRGGETEKCGRNAARRLLRIAACQRKHRWHGAGSSCLAAHRRAGIEEEGGRSIAPGLPRAAHLCLLCCLTLPLPLSGLLYSSAACISHLCGSQKN